mmetsp:Transcript_4134/g.6219  ORF Transcript_4134/g.6219 Transcript_4134/m.6219 type:complete len:252 (-) Transcript_4134:107-862(-)
MRKQIRQLFFLRRGRQRFKHGRRKWRVDSFNVNWCWYTCNLDDAIELVHGRVTWKHWFTTKEFTKNATNRPNINTFGVLGRTKQNFWCAVPARGNIISQHWICCCVKRRNRTREAKISQLEKTLRVEQQVAWLDITMNHFSRMHVFERFEQLIHDVLFVNIFQDVCPNDSVQIGLHILKNQINVPIIIRLQYVCQFHDVFMIRQFLQEHNFSKRTLGIGGVLKRVKDLFQRNHLFRFLISCFPYNTICTFA